MKIPDQSRLVMIGDSVTDCGRARPVGEGLSGELGHGYVACIDAVLRACYPVQRIAVLNVGISGNTVRDLEARWDGDVLALKPNWLSVMIGINDVWRQFDGGMSAAVFPEEFERTYDRLLARVKPHLRGLVLASPFYIEPRKEDPMRRRMDEYGAIVKTLAARHGAIFVDTQAAFDRALVHHPSTTFAHDCVHPNLTGHMVLARAFLDALGFEWPRQNAS